MVLINIEMEQYVVLAILVVIIVQALLMQTALAVQLIQLFKQIMHVHAIVAFIEMIQ